MVNYVATFFSLLWVYCSDIYIWTITLLGIPAIFLCSLPEKLSKTGRRASVAALIVLGIVAGVSNIQQKAKATEEMKLLISGGGSIPKVGLFFDHEFLSLVVLNVGKYPMFDTTMQVFDHEQVKQREAEFKKAGKPYTIEDSFFGPIKNVHVGTVQAGSRERLFHYMRVKRKTKFLNFTFDITTRNGSYQQKTNAVRDGDKWHVTNEGAAFKVPETLTVAGGRQSNLSPAILPGVSLGTGDNN